MNHLNADNLKISFASVIQGSEAAGDDLEKLQTLIQIYPYCQALYSMQARAQKDNPAAFEKSLAKAAVYTPDRQVLYNFIHRPESLSAATSATTADIELIETIIPERELPSFEEDTFTPEVEEKTPAERPFFDNIASSDYFTFNQSTVDPRAEFQEENPIEPEKQEAADTRSQPDEKPTDTAEVSKYHDDEMPYTFLWWLHKTRKEHAHTYQPYAGTTSFIPQPPKKNPVDELNHQIIENIFHLQVPISNEEASGPQTHTIQFELKRKSTEDIIERFIKEEPQIRPPRAENIDTENKARKSSEDNFDLVSETLAQIYIEQMLYHKAIDTYKKLRLKFPEKSAYFADQITELYKKIS